MESGGSRRGEVRCRNRSLLPVGSERARLRRYAASPNLSGRTPAHLSFTHWQTVPAPGPADCAARAHRCFCHRDLSHGLAVGPEHRDRGDVAGQ